LQAPTPDTERRAISFSVFSPHADRSKALPLRGARHIGVRTNPTRASAARL